LLSSEKSPTPSPSTGTDMWNVSNGVRHKRDLRHLISQRLCSEGRRSFAEDGSRSMVRDIVVGGGGYVLTLTRNGPSFVAWTRECGAMPGCVVTAQVVLTVCTVLMSVSEIRPVTNDISHWDSPIPCKDDQLGTSHLFAASVVPHRRGRFPSSTATDRPVSTFNPLIHSSIREERQINRRSQLFSRASSSGPCTRY
jgi:hypothetical protein